jgi:hypothetical protein
MDKEISDFAHKKGEQTPQSPEPKRVTPAMFEPKPLKPIIKSKWDSAIKYEGLTGSGSKQDLIEN